MPMRYETKTRTIEPYDLSDLPPERKKAALAWLPHTPTVLASSPPAPRHVTNEALSAFAKTRAELRGTSDSDSADRYDSDVFDSAETGGFDLNLDLRLDRTSDDDAGEVGLGKVMGAAEAQDAMVRAQKDAWKPGFRKRDGARRPGAVTDPLGRPLSGASRSSVGSAPSAVAAALYEPRELGDEEHVDEPMFRGMELNDPASLGQGEDDGSAEDSRDAMVARQKDAWKPQNRKRRGDGASTSAGFATGEDVDPQVEMVERARLAGLQPLRRVRQGG
jgi:hypothetical protein